MRGKVAKKRILEFQDVEDAHINQQQLLSKQSKPSLVILDDVWSGEDLKELLFEGPAYKTLITTKDKSIIYKSLSITIVGHRGCSVSFLLLGFWT